MTRATFGKRSGGAHRVAVRRLGGREVVLRDGTSDAATAVSVFARLYHRPPPGVEPALIWDLGANVGLTMADFGLRFPNAVIVGVEPDAGNVHSARRNIAFLGERAQLLQGAVWPVDGQVRLGAGSEAGFRVEQDGGQTVPAISLNALLARTGPPGFVKVDIEGSEQ
jgi:FkbM family methyltransferase